MSLKPLQPKVSASPTSSPAAPPTSATTSAASSLSQSMASLSISSTTSDNNSQASSPISASASSSSNTSGTTIATSENTATTDPHPLARTWTFWYLDQTGKNSSQSSKSNWNDKLRICGDAHTIEEFWGIFNTLKNPIFLPIRSDAHLFIKGVQPAWEDPANSGGCWQIEYREPNEAAQAVMINALEARAEHAASPSKTSPAPVPSAYALLPHGYNGIVAGWLNTLLALIGEEFPHSELINGAVFGIRKSPRLRLQLWTASCSEPEMLAIGRAWKRIVNYKGNIPFAPFKSDNSDPIYYV